MVININCCIILKNKFYLKKNSVIQQVISTRMKVLSEEKLFTSYYILGSLSDKLIKQQTSTPKLNNFVFHGELKKYGLTTIPAREFYKRGRTFNIN